MAVLALLPSMTSTTMKEAKGVPGERRRLRHPARCRSQHMVEPLRAGGVPTRCGEARHVSNPHDRRVIQQLLPQSGQEDGAEGGTPAPRDSSAYLLLAYSWDRILLTHDMLS